MPMPRAPRFAPGGYVAHALNRAVARLPLFEKAGDFAAFQRGVALAQARCPIRTSPFPPFARGGRGGYCLMPDQRHCLLWPLNHLRVHHGKPLGDGQGAKSMVGTNEFDRLTGFVEVDRRGQLKGIECSEVFGRTDSTNQPLGRLEVSGGQADNSQSSRRHIAPKPSRQLLKICWSSSPIRTFLANTECNSTTDKREIT